MNIVMVGNYWNTPQGGGLDRYFADLAMRLHKRGGQPVALVNEAAEGSPEWVRPFGSGGLLGRWRSLRRLADPLLDGHSLLNPHFALYAFPFLGLLRGGELPVVCHFHGPWSAESWVEDVGSSPLRREASARVKWLLEAAVYARCRHFITLSEAFAQVLHAEYGVPHEQIAVIPGGVDTERFAPAAGKPELRQRLGWPTDRPIMLSVRRLARRMGLENLIIAMVEVRRRCPDVLLLIGGRGPMAEGLASQIRELGLTEHVKLIGFIPEADLPAAYGAADISVVPTVGLEGFGLTVVESLASGTPVLGTPVGGVPEILRPLSESLLFESMSPAALADRLIAVLTGKAAVPTPTGCREYAVSRFDWEVIAGRVVDLFQEVIG